MIHIDTVTVFVIVGTLLDRSVTNIMTVLVLSFFQDRGATYPNEETEVLHDVERIASSLENL